MALHRRLISTAVPGRCTLALSAHGVSDGKDLVAVGVARYLAFTAGEEQEPKRQAVQSHVSSFYFSKINKSGSFSFFKASSCFEHATKAPGYKKNSTKSGDSSMQADAWCGGVR